MYTHRYLKAFAQSDVFNVNQLALDVFDWLISVTLVK